MTSLTAVFVPAGLWILLVVFIVSALLVWYALYSKNDVMATFALGATMFKLEAKGRVRRKGSKPKRLGARP